MTTPTSDVFPTKNQNGLGFINSLNNVGTAATGVTADDYGDGYNHVTILRFTDLAVGAATGAAALAFGKLLYTLPIGAQIISVANASVTLAGVEAIDADTPDVGVGTVIASGVVSVLGGTGTFENIITGQTSGAIDGTNAINVTISNQILSRLAADAKTIFLNVADTWAAAGAVTATGSITLVWTTLNP